MKAKYWILAGILFCSCLYILISHRSKQTVNRGRIQFNVTESHKENLLIQWNEMIRKYLQLPLDNHYGSHAIVLLATAFVSQKGPMLELGMGYTSTPLLTRLSYDQKRILVSADSDLRWINHFTSYGLNNSLHTFKHVEVRSELGVEWALSGISDLHNWSFVLIDHRPGGRRQFELWTYAYRSDIVILHDTEQTAIYKYEHGLQNYRYKYRFTQLKTYTDVLSTTNSEAIEQIRYLLESTPKSMFIDPNLNETIQIRS